MNFACLVFFGLLSASSGAAQEREPIATDRPGLSFSPITVPRGAFQIEVGLTQVELVESLIGSTLLPVGDHAFTIHEDHLGFALNGVTGWSLEQVGITAVTGVAWTPVGEDDYVTNGNFVLLVGRSLSEKTSGYLETGWFPREDADEAPVLVGAGFAHLLAPVVQLDAFVDAGLTDEATDWTFGAGVSTRLP